MGVGVGARVCLTLTMGSTDSPGSLLEELSQATLQESTEWEGLVASSRDGMTKV